MKIKKDEHLQVLAEASGQPANKVTTKIIAELISNGIIEDDSENWGYPIGECYVTDVTVKKMVGVLHAVGITSVHNVHMEALLGCILIGDGDCPECGGEMEPTDGEYHRVGGDGYNTPLEYAPTWEEKTCRHCGHKECEDLSFKVKR